MAFELKADEKVVATVAFTDASGAVTAIDGIPSWSMTVDGIVSLDVAADGLSATLGAKAVGSVGLVIDAGAAHIKVTTDLTVVAVTLPGPGPAVAGTITFGTPTKL